MKTEIDLEILAGRLAAQDALIGLLMGLVVDGRPSAKRRLVNGLEAAQIDAVRAGKSATARILGDRLAALGRALG